MNGAESLARTLSGGGVNVCFANPGTSEMHFVAALDRVAGIRCVLGLFEGVVTGAADGYGRMAGKPAATLLHLGPGLANGLANLHNAHRARTPIVNIVGDHATYHRQYDAPLTSDVEGIGRPFSHWLRTSKNAGAVAADAADAIVAARTPPGSIATLILPADTAWSESTGPVAVPPAPSPPAVSDAALQEAVRLVRQGRTTGLLLAGPGLREKGLEMAGRIAAKTGIRLLSTYGVPRIERGAGRVAVEPIPYPVDPAIALLSEFRHLILLGAQAPVAFFAYPGKPSLLTPKECGVHVLAQPHEDIMLALEALMDATGARTQPAAKVALEIPAAATGAITAAALGQSIGALLPDNAIVCDELVSSGAPVLRYTQAARPHDLMKNVGGAIGFGLPAAVGAAIACPDRKVLCLQADGSAMYTVQALWTQAREKLNITTVIFANRSYAILKNELANVQAGNPGPRALDMLNLDRPDLDWCAIATGMGVSAARVTDMAGFNRALAGALASSAPHLIEVVM